MTRLTAARRDELRAWALENLPEAQAEPIVLALDELSRRRRSKRKREPYEAPAIGGMVRRMIRALVKRAQAGDTEALEQLHQLESFVPTQVTAAGRGLHEFGYSWGELSAALGISRQACAKRFGKTETDGDA